MWGCPKGQRPKTQIYLLISCYTELNPWFSSRAAWIFLGQAWETCSIFTKVCKSCSCPFHQNWILPVHRNAKRAKSVFVVSGFPCLGVPLIYKFAYTLPTSPKPHHLENSPSRPAHACQPEGSWPVGRVGMLEQSKALNIPRPFYFIYRKKITLG